MGMVMGGNIVFATMKGEEFGMLTLAIVFLCI